jgi:hypothetical protein
VAKRSPRKKKPIRQRAKEWFRGEDIIHSTYPDAHKVGPIGQLSEKERERLTKKIERETKRTGKTPEQIAVEYFGNSKKIKLYSHDKEELPGGYAAYADSTDSIHIGTKRSPYKRFIIAAHEVEHYNKRHPHNEESFKTRRILKRKTAKLSKRQEIEAEKKALADVKAFMDEDDPDVLKARSKLRSVGTAIDNPKDEARRLKNRWKYGGRERTKQKILNKKDRIKETIKKEKKLSRAAGFTKRVGKKALAKDTYKNAAKKISKKTKTYHKAGKQIIDEKGGTNKAILKGTKWGMKKGAKGAIKAPFAPAKAAKYSIGGSIGLMKKRRQKVRQLHKAGKQTRIEKAQGKAAGKIKQARSNILNQKGIKGIFSPKFIALLFTQTTISRPIPILIAIIVAGAILNIIFFHVISVMYGAYVLKALPAVAYNSLATIGNALWFALHAIKELLIMAFTHIINMIFKFFLVNIIDAIEMIVNWIPGLNFNLAESQSIEKLLLPTLGPEEYFAIPSSALSYVYPKPAFWGDWNSMTTYIWVKPGFDVYNTPWIVSTLDTINSHPIVNLPPGLIESVENIVTAAQMQAILEGAEVGDTTYVLAGVHNGASVWAPTYNQAAIAPDGWISNIDNSGSFVRYTAGSYVEHIKSITDVLIDTKDFFTFIGEEIAGFFTQGLGSSFSTTITNPESGEPVQVWTPTPGAKIFWEMWGK